MFSAAFDKLVYGEGKYYQLPRASFAYLCNVRTKRGDWLCLSAAFDKPVYGEGKVLPVTARLSISMKLISPTANAFYCP